MAWRVWACQVCLVSAWGVLYTCFDTQGDGSNHPFTCNNKLLHDELFDLWPNEPNWYMLNKAGNPVCGGGYNNGAFQTEACTARDCCVPATNNSVRVATCFDQDGDWNSDYYGYNYDNGWFQPGYEASFFYYSDDKYDGCSHEGLDPVPMTVACTDGSCDALSCCKRAYSCGDLDGDGTSKMFDCAGAGLVPRTDRDGSVWCGLHGERCRIDQCCQPMKTCEDTHGDQMFTAFDCAGQSHPMLAKAGNPPCGNGTESCTVEHCCDPLPKTCADIGGDGNLNAFDCAAQSQSMVAKVGNLQCGDGTEDCTAAHCCKPAQTCADTGGDGLDSAFDCGAEYMVAKAGLRVCGNGTETCTAEHCCEPAPKTCADIDGFGGRHSPIQFDCARTPAWPMMVKAGTPQCGDGTENCTAEHCCDPYPRTCADIDRNGGNTAFNCAAESQLLLSRAGTPQCGDGTEICTAAHCCVPAKACNDEHGDGTNQLFACDALSLMPLDDLNVMCGDGSSMAACDAATCCRPKTCADTSGDGTNKNYDCAAELQPMLAKAGSLQCGDGTESCTAAHCCVPAKACNDENGDGTLNDSFSCPSPTGSPLDALNIMCGDGSSTALCDAATCCKPVTCGDTAGDGSNRAFDCAAETQPMLTRLSLEEISCGGGSETCTSAMCCQAAKACNDVDGDGVTGDFFDCGFEKILQSSVKCGDGTSSAVCDAETCCAMAGDQFLQKTRKDRAASFDATNTEIESANKAAAGSSIAFLVGFLLVVMHVF